MADFSVGDLQTPAQHFTASDVPVPLASLDAALADALGSAQPVVVKCDLLGGGPVESFRIREQVSGAFSPVIEFRADSGLGQVVLVLKGAGGACVYAAAKIQSGTRWVALESLARFYALAEADRKTQRKAWTDKLGKLKKAKWPAALLPARDRLNSLSSVALQLLLAWLGPVGSIPVFDKEEPPKRRGAVSKGATLPVFRYPLVEPECYLRVISGSEGWLESINAWDLNAGISVGPIQFNAQGGFVIKFLHEFHLLDPDLFAQCFAALNWMTKQSGTDPVLVVGGTPPIELIGRHKDDQRNIGYFQSGVPGKTKFKDINAAFRKDLTTRFRDATVWPHVQRIILDISADWLQPGLDRLADANYAAIDPKRPDRDLFVLKALLLSCFVRFSGSLSHLIRRLKPFSTPRKKIEALESVLLGPDEWPNFGKTKQEERARREELAGRVEKQRPMAEAVWDTINRLADGTSLAGVAAAPMPEPSLTELASHVAEMRELLAKVTGGIISGQDLPLGASAGSPTILADARFLASAGLEAANVDETVLRRLAKGSGQELPMDRLIALRNERYPQSYPRFWAVVDFDLHSSKPRMFVFDVVAETVASYLCAHGKGSEGPKNDGYAEVFSNKSGSNASSLGIYRCAETYNSTKNGYSLRLDGLEATNSNARSRAIVVHGADYVSASFVKKHGRIGRSDGCPALDRKYSKSVIDQLKQGSLLIHWKAP
jgi:hypothetical protein